MKTIIIATGLAIVMYVAVMFIPNVTEVSVIKEDVEKEVIEVPAWQTDEEAIKAAQAVIRRKELEAELNALESNFEASTASFEAEKAKYKEEKTRLEKELNVY